MKEGTAIKVYILILREINGWSQKEINKLTMMDIEGDPIFEKLKLIKDDDAKLTNNKAKEIKDGI